MAFGLALVALGIGIATIRVRADWISPGVEILPILAGGLLLWPRALRILFAIVAAMLAYDWLNDRKAGFGITATVVLTALFAGKGIEAGTRALLLSGAFGGLLGSVPHSEYLQACNAYLQRGGPPESFVTAVYLTLDLVTGDYLISSAGHPPAAQFESGSGRWRLATARGMVLGVVPDLRTVPGNGHLRSGDALMLYTDGLVEVPGRDIDAGIDRLLGEADLLVANGFREGAGRLVQTMQGAGPNSDDCALALIWRS
jgi:hypothetical protein